VVLRIWADRILCVAAVPEKRCPLSNSGCRLIGHVTNAVVNVNGVSRASSTVFKSSTELDVTIIAADIQVPGELEISVFTPAPGGGTSDPMMFTVSPATNPTPVLSNLSVTQVQVDSTKVAPIILTGTGFIPSSRVLVNGFPRTTTFNTADPTHLSAQLLDSDFSVLSQLQVRVSNPEPGGGTSNTVNLAVFAPAPSLASIAPAAATAGTGPVAITLTGSNFIDESSVLVNGSARGSSVVPGSNGTQLTSTLTAADVASGVLLSITVANPTNPPGGGTSAAVTFTVNNPQPALDPATPLTPASIVAGTRPPPSITVLGTGFVPTSQVTINQQNRATYVDPTRLSVALQASDIASGGTIALAVFNPTPAGGTSATAVLTVNNPPPTVTTVNGLSPASVVVGSLTGNQTTPITVLAAGFVPTSTVSINGSNRAAFVDSTHLTVTLNATDVATAGPIPITVVNPTPGGGTSNTVNFTVTNPAPVVTGLDQPAQTTNISPLPQITVLGSSFVNGATAQIKGTNHAALGGSNSTNLVIQLIANDLSAAGSFPVMVTNPGPGGGVSTTSATLTVYDPPVITGLSPNNATVGQLSPPAVTVTGANFIPGSVVMLNGASHVPSTASTTTQLFIQLTLDPDLNVPAGVYPITVITPTPGGVSTPNANSNFTLNNPPPAGSSLSLVAVTTNVSPPPQLTILGTSFVIGATPATSSSVQIGGGAPHAPLAGSDSKHLIIQLTAADVGKAGSYVVTVTNPPPGGGVSTVPTQFNVYDPPVVSGLSPNNATVGQEPPPPVTVTGANFIPGSVVMLNGASHTPSAASTATQLFIQLTLDPDLNFTAGVYPITVVTPTPGGVSTPNANSNFTLNNPPPVMSSTPLTPTSTVAGSGAQTSLMIQGTGFVRASKVTFNGQDHTTSTTFVDATHLQIALAAGETANAGTFSVVVTNSAPGGGSATATFVVNNPTGTITSLLPSNVTAGSAGFTLTVNGTSFLSGATVLVNGASHTTTFVSSTQLTAAIPASDIASAGSLSITVLNPPPTAGPSAPVNLTVSSFDTFLQDVNTHGMFKFNSKNGNYTFLQCSSGFTLSGTGTVTLANGLINLQDNKTDRRISAGFNPGQRTGSATLTIAVAQGVWQIFRINSSNPNPALTCQ